MGTIVTDTSYFREDGGLHAALVSIGDNIPQFAIGSMRHPTADELAVLQASASIPIPQGFKAQVICLDQQEVREIISDRQAWYSQEVKDAITRIMTAKQDENAISLASYMAVHFMLRKRLLAAQYEMAGNDVFSLVNGETTAADGARFQIFVGLYFKRSFLSSCAPLLADLTASHATHTAQVESTPITHGRSASPKRKWWQFWK